MKTRCILKEDCCCGMYMFWKEPCKTKDEEFNQEYVHIYDGMDCDRLVAIMHVSGTIDIPDDVKVIKKWGSLFPEDSWLNLVRKDWANKGEEK